jgi:hypothetical protein
MIMLFAVEENRCKWFSHGFPLGIAEDEMNLPSMAWWRTGQVDK